MRHEKKRRGAGVTERLLMLTVVCTLVMMSVGLVYAAHAVKNGWAYIAIYYNGADKVTQKISMNWPSGSTYDNSCAAGASAKTITVSGNGNGVTVSNGTTTKRNASTGTTDSTYLYCNFPIKVTGPTGYHYVGTQATGNYGNSQCGFVSASGTQTVSATWVLNMTEANLRTTGGSYTDHHVTERVKFVPNTYTVVYHGNGNTGGSTASSSHTYGTAKTLTSNGFTKTGHSFAGWATSASGSAVYSNGQSVSNLTATQGGTVNLYAKWKVNSYTLTYNANGGSVSPASKSLAYGSAYGTLPTPARSGCRFNGWYTAASGGSAVSASTTMGAGNATIYAHWTEYKVTLNYFVNGGAVNTGTGTTRWRASGGRLQKSDNSGSTWYNVTQAIYTGTAYGDMWNVGTPPITRAGYHIVGTSAYNTAAGGTGLDLNQDYSSGSTANPVTAYRLNGNKYLTADISVNVYPKWIANTYKVHYNANGGSGSMADSTHVYDTGSRLSKNGFWRKGYTFGGWNTDAAGTGDDYGDQQTVSTLTSASGGTVNLYAQWEPIEYTVRFYPNGGEGEVRSEEVAYDGSLSMPEADCENPEHAFLGWNTREDGIGRKAGVRGIYHFQPGEDFSPSMLDDSDFRRASDNDGEIEFYAQWRDLSSTVYFRANGGTGHMASQTVVLGEDTPLEKCRFRRSGYLFAGWSKSPDGTAPLYANKSSADALPWPKRGNRLDLYAVWRKGHFSMSGQSDADDQVVTITPDEEGRARLRTKLADGQMVNLFGLDRHARFSIIEDGNKVYRPSFDTERGSAYMETPSLEGLRGQELATDVETLYGDTDIRFTNTLDDIPDGYTLSFTKKLKGDGITAEDRALTFPFRYVITGLDPDFRYVLAGGSGAETALQPEDGSGTGTTLQPEDGSSGTGTALQPEDGSALAPERSGVLTGTVWLAGGQTASFRNLPKGAKYNITEVTRPTGTEPFNYSARYDVTEGTAQSMASDSQVILPENPASAGGTDSAPGLSGAGVGLSGSTEGPGAGVGLSTNAGGSERIGGYGAETITGDVHYVFTNSRGGAHSLTLQKVVKVDGMPAPEEGEAFTFRVFFSGLRGSTDYSADEGECSFRTDEKGSAALTLTLRAGEAVTWNGLDAGCEYEIVEQMEEYESSAEIREQGADGWESVCRVDGGYGTGVSVGSHMDRSDGSGDPVDFDRDQMVVVTNDRITRRSLKISKTVEDSAGAMGSGEAAGGSVEGSAAEAGAQAGAAADRTFRYTAAFQGLEPSASYAMRVYTDGEDPEDPSAGETTSFRAGDHGNAEVTFRLEDRGACIFPALKAGARYTVTEAGSDRYQPSYAYLSGGPDTGNNDEEDSEGIRVTGAEGEDLATAETVLNQDAEIRFTNTRQYEKPMKRVSDADGRTMTGEGDEKLVEENFVQDPETPWTYTITQEMDAGFDSLVLEDVMPANTRLLPETMDIEFRCRNGTTYRDAAVKVEQEDEPDCYQTDLFRIETDAFQLTLESRNEDVIRQGGELTLRFSAAAELTATEENYMTAGQLTPDRSFVKFRNVATVVMGEVRQTTNTAVTTIPLPARETGLRIHKEVTGNLGDISKAFAFRADFSGLDPEAVYYLGTPEYLEVTQEYEAGRVIASVMYKDMPIENVSLKVYSTEDGSLMRERTTDEEGRTSFALEPGVYRYVIRSRKDVLDTCLPVTESESIPPLRIVKKSGMMEFAADYDGNASVEFELKDDEGVTFLDLREGTKFSITEKASDHTASYAFLRGAASAVSPVGAGSGPKQELSTGIAVLTGGVESTGGKERADSEELARGAERTGGKELADGEDLTESAESTDERAPIVVFTNCREQAPITGGARGWMLLLLLGLAMLPALVLQIRSHLL